MMLPFNENRPDKPDVNSKVLGMLINNGLLVPKLASFETLVTIAIANTAPITIVTVMRISFQGSLHHSQALSTFSFSQLFSISGFKYSYLS